MGNENVAGNESHVEPVQPATGKRKYDRSTVGFPYSDLDTAIGVARTIHTRAGTSCSPDQLAAWMDKTASGGTFRAWLSAARIFGFVETERGKVSLSELGREAIHPDTEQSAKINAFLNVPLHQEMYEQYNGYALPPAAAIERQMVELGVAKKQADRARQTFMKSAQAAGFIDPPTGRFIKPAVGGQGHKDEGHGNQEAGKGGGGGDGPTNLDPVIKGLVDKLPPPGSVWKEPDRKLWLQILESSFKLIYIDETVSD